MVTDFAAVQAMVREALDAWGWVDILVNNAGILRDKSFAKMDLADLALVMNVHRMGATRNAAGFTGQCSDASPRGGCPIPVVVARDPAGTDAVSARRSGGLAGGNR